MKRRAALGNDQAMCLLATSRPLLLVIPRMESPLRTLGSATLIGDSGGAQ